MVRKMFRFIYREYNQLGWWHVFLWIGFSTAFLYGPVVFFDNQTAFLFFIRTLGINA
ncbi:hypothetical protein [Marinilabilia salmonicolor]|nr:hypothetical protein [Marinilabilia salmonicolor]